MPKSNAQRRARAKWDGEHLTTLGTQCRREQADKYRSAAARAGTTVSAVMRSALDKLLEEYPDNTGDSNTAPAADNDT